MTAGSPATFHESVSLSSYTDPCAILCHPDAGIAHASSVLVPPGQDGTAMLSNAGMLAEARLS